MPVTTPPEGTHVTYSQQYRRCGKATCPACMPGKKGHGPYWYAYWREGGRVHSRYLGRQVPTGTLPKESPAQLTMHAADGPPAGSAQGMLWVRTLGGFQVWRGGLPVPGEEWARQKVAALFKYLLAAPNFRLPRRVLVETLWPGVDPDTGAGYLRTALHWLRKILDGPDGAHIRLQGESLILGPANSGPEDWLDAAAFSQAVRAALASRDAALCLAALARYEGDYLPEDKDEEWAIQSREKLRQQRLAVLLHLADVHVGQRKLREAVRCLQAVLAADPCHEAAARALIRLHAVGGRRLEALRIYRCLAEALSQELDLLPEPATQALYQLLQQDTPASGTPSVERVLAGVAGLSLLRDWEDGH